ncbi:hypothetical protein MOF38_14435 [Bacillus haynesii]|uniref:hypothetical protein n=1 Tax=Bacillus haynesii TaxID=1925021 RepID=UPI00227FFB70|nr:hypothetical protein [Bacillus haynesii]MCY7769520.1 hypothetical protein [Bacillus haynesii]MCY8014831.1 hypothetical protein [Bacillus haynesii]MCY8077242.1 hypothetical protein [Bacillus haynesii]MCY8350340.1 hypothetical protein [Bacillus haynesii]MCY8755822.1 hypothetical protein [Bacillus haynesii]
MNKSEVLEIFEEVLEEWCSFEMTLISQSGDDSDDLERREKLFRQRFIEALNKV